MPGLQSLLNHHPLLKKLNLLLLKDSMRGLRLLLNHQPALAQEAQPAAVEGGAVATDPLVDQPGAAKMV